MVTGIRRLYGTVLIVAALALIVASCSDDDVDTGAIHILTIDGDIGPITERYIDRGISRAEQQDAALILIEMDTPGGLVSSMRDIVQHIEGTDIPVVTYVTPAGGQAASAGTLIAMSAHIAAMAPNTTIGAASVVDSSGGDVDGTLGRKITNDTAALARGIAELRGRNEEWADQAVREAVSASGSEAVELNVVDLVAADRADLLTRIEGRTVAIDASTEVTLTGLTMAPLVETEFTGWERFLDFIADPNIAAILLSVGALAILVEVFNPGMFVPGVTGVIALALGFLGFGIMPVDTAGLVLIGIGMALLILEAVVVSGGVLGGGALVAFVLGGIVAFRDTPAEFQPSGLLVIILLGLLSMILLSTALGAWGARRQTAAVGTSAMIGLPAQVRTRLNPDGYIFVLGERWSAHLVSGAAESGETVRIVGADGLKLFVEKESERL